MQKYKENKCSRIIYHNSCFTYLFLISLDKRLVTVFIVVTLNKSYQVTASPIIAEGFNNNCTVDLQEFLI